MCLENKVSLKWALALSHHIANFQKPEVLSDDLPHFPSAAGFWDEYEMDVVSEAQETAF